MGGCAWPDHTWIHTILASLMRCYSERPLWPVARLAVGLLGIERQGLRALNGGTEESAKSSAAESLALVA
jgi:hypothetical protein